MLDQNSLDPQELSRLLEVIDREAEGSYNEALYERLLGLSDNLYTLEVTGLPDLERRSLMQLAKALTNKLSDRIDEIAHGASPVGLDDLVTAVAYGCLLIGYCAGVVRDDNTSRP